MHTTEYRDKLPSLRTRYVALTVMLGLLVIVVAFLFYSDVVESNHAATNELVELTERSNKLDKVRANLTEIDRGLDLFLLDPSRGNYPEKLRLLIGDSTNMVGSLTSTFWRQEDRLVGISVQLESDFTRLQQGIDTLVESRMDVNRQYPGMAISAQQMSQPQQSVSSHLQLLIDEIENGEMEPNAEVLYPKLLKSYTLWMQQISQMRIYLANRFASFSNEILIDQAQSLQDLHEKFLVNVDALIEIYETEDSFEGASAIDAVKRDALLWMSLFEEVRAISESDRWRTDNHLMQTNIIPLTDEISTSLQNMELRFGMKEAEIAEKLRKNAETLSALLFIIILLFLMFISAILFSMNRMVFRPISSVVKALRSKAFDMESPELRAPKHREIGALVESFREMDEQVNQRQSDLEHQALHDHLTGIPNRFMLNQRLEYLLLTAEQEQRHFSLLLMDLDNFKDVNDSLGHATGDLLLIEVAARLAASVGKADTVARLGGDEFAFLLPDVSKAEAEVLADSIAERVTSPFSINKHQLTVGVSIGVVSYPEDGADAMNLLQHADMAMYVAKRGRFIQSSYDAREDFYSANRLSLINDLRRALDSNELEVYYQPQVSLSGDRVSGAEALLRWNHPEHGFIQPEKIIELAEHASIIHALSLWVMNQAIAQCSTWHRHGEFISVSVNLSVHDLANPELCRETEKLLSMYQLPSQFLTLEITENGMMENPARSIEVLNTLNEMGVILSIDDFGTGFSSLSYLKQLPVHELKIDKSFVLNMDNDESDAVIVQSTVNLGHNLGLKVTAEGVEHKVHLDVARGFGCDQAQGYLFSKPKNSDEFMRWLSEVSDNAIKQA